MPRRPSRVFVPETPADPALEFGKLKSTWKKQSLKEPSQLDQLLFELSVPPNLRPAISTLYEAELFYVPTLPPATSLKEIAALAKKLEPARRNAADAITTQIVDLFAEHAPEIITGINLGNVPFITLTKNPNKLVSDIVFKLSGTALPGGKDPLFGHYSPILRRNVALASEGAREKYVNPLHSKLTPIELVHAYLKDTPFVEILIAPIPYRLSDKLRREHWHILANTGHGKSQAIQHIVYSDILREDAPAIVLIEPKGDVVEKLSRLAIFEKDPDRLAIIDPKYNPALNIFAAHSLRRIHSGATSEDIEGDVISLYSYIFGALDADISKQQSTALSYIVALTLAKHPTMDTFLDILNNPANKIEDSGLEDDIKAMDRYDQQFFENVFFKGTFPATRRALATKIFGLFKVAPPFKRMFRATDNHLDMYERISKPGNITLINTSQGSLKKDGSSFFGRYMIAQTMAAAMERNALPDHKRNTVFLVVDEAQLYFDETFEDIFTLARSSGLGIIFAHHFLAQLKWPSLRTAALNMPAIKLAAPVDDDMSTMAHALRTTPSFLTAMRSVDRRYAEYGVFARNMGQKSAARITIPFGSVEENAPHMSPPVHKALIEGNRKRFAQGAEPPSEREEKPEIPKPSVRPNLPDAD